MGARPPVGNLVTQALGIGSILALVFLPGLNCIQFNCSLAPSRRRWYLQVSMPCNGKLDWPSVKCGEHYNSGQYNVCRIVGHHPHLLPRPPVTWNWNALHVVLPFGSFIHRIVDMATTITAAAKQMSFSHFGGSAGWWWYLHWHRVWICFGGGPHHMRGWAWRMSMVDGHFKRPLAGLIVRTHWLK